MADPSIHNLLQRARARLLAHLTLDKGALAAVIGLGGAVLLLLVGTQLLEWYWVLLLTVASLGTGLYQMRQNIPSLYVLAQRIDWRLKTADSLSTALYFSEHPEPARQAVCDRQRIDAASVAGRVDLRQAIPYTRSRYLAPAAGLAVIAVGLFGLRYAVTGSMSLEPSLLRMAMDSFFGAKPLEARNLKMQQKAGQGKDGADPGTLEDQAKESQPDPLQDSAEAQTPDNSPGDDNQKEAQNGDSSDKDSDKNGDKNADDKSDQSKEGKDGDSKEGQQDKGKDGKEQDGKQSSKSGQENSSLMNKLKDALANMMSKMKPQDQSQKAGKDSKQDSKQQQSQKGDQSQGDSAQAEANAGNDQSPSDNKESADSKSGQKASDKNASQDSKSGAGSQDGDKAAKLAEQIQAMGKISEILGKRSATLTGEVLVEVGSTKQQLKTPWQQKQAAHSEAGSEIHRDEVPLMYQQFVQQYFEEIRKPLAKPAAR